MEEKKNLNPEAVEEVEKESSFKAAVKKHGTKVLVAAGIGAVFIIGKLSAAAGNRDDDILSDDTSSEE